MFKSIILLLYFIFSKSFEIKKPKICINCKHYFIEKDNDNILKARCLYFTKNKENEENVLMKEYIKRKEIIYLVTGKDINKIVNKRDLYFCCTARSFEHLCGIDGKKYDEKAWFHLL